ncbi:TonB-dependent receptor [Aurantibacillus circumpalustris]|uniref:TonB-dependent receptor n=1 Tax=Aurantibacillus circumpalustris TaxID=3036359 RepID=UPI00295B6A3F|nr:TonB-dependent receptor [Aurantibacillus circumpalustris]
MNRFNIIFCAIAFLVLVSNKKKAQTVSQTIRGTVVDKISQTPIPGAVIQVLNSNPLQVVSSDMNGDFKLTNVLVGKQSLRIAYLGYKEIFMQNLSLNAGKELVLNVNMEEDAMQMQEVEITAKVEKNKPLNDMSAVSTRAFSVEETQKFAAAANDPARMALAFAGVVAAGDGNNNISIRGNSPNGLLWRMEGVEIPNPNHFSNVGTSGGGISILSAQLLNNSDFSTGAFAAEYGNALSGVFDLKLRKGNNQKHEYTVQLGVLGLDLSTEGPFKKGYGGSYLINYRYSTLSVLGKIGVPLGNAITNFQDLSFNISLPTKKFGSFGVFGFGGISDQTAYAKKDSALWNEDSFYRADSKFYANTGAIGLTNTLLLKNQSYLKTALVYSGTQNGYKQDKLENDYTTFIRDYEQKFVQTKLTLSSVYTQKISAKSNIRTGIILNQLGYSLSLRDMTDTTVLIDKIKVEGNTQTAQAFFQWNYKLTKKLTTNLGLHYFQLFLNNSNSVEPRASLKYELTPKNNLSLGYGLHSQLQPIGVYFAKQNLTDDSYTTPNKNLGLSKAHHLVVGYDRVLNEFSHIKTELYYQHLYNIPISNDRTGTYSILNVMDGYNTEPLTNKGLGRNYGAELTYERFLHKNLYYLLSASLYDSKYKAANNKWYNTRFNTNFALTFTAGKEWVLSGGTKNRIIGFNIKSIYVGGFRYTPIDLQASIAAGEQKIDDTKTFAEQNPAYYRLDIRISLKRNYKHVTSTLALDIQNTTNRKNVGGQYFDSGTGEVKYWYQTPLLPLLSYRLEF